MGFRDLHGFNLALLGKQCWNLISKPEALVSRVLKARYFLHCHFLEANRTGGSSYTWSGLWEAKEELKKGLRWVLGDGRSINICKDRWLRGKTNFSVNVESVDAAVLDQKVYQFIGENKTWDVNKVRSIFAPEDAEAILNTRILQICTKDRLAWFHSNDGRYTVKSGYQQWYLNHGVDVGLQGSKGWDKIWSLKIPHKIKIFLWRFCRNNIPIRNLLRLKGISVPIGCEICVVI